MSKRLEVYVDAGLLSFALSLVVFLVLAMGARPLIGLLGGAAFTLTIIGPAVLIGTALAIWVSWILHRHTTHEPMTREESVKVSWVALAAAIVAPALVGGYMAIGATTAVLWVTVAVLLLALGAWLVVDAIADLFKAREHRTIDVVRILLVALLGFSLVASLVQPAQLGSEQDISPYVLIITAYMIVVALVTYGYDELVSWRKRSHVTQAPLSPSV